VLNEVVFYTKFSGNFAKHLGGFMKFLKKYYFGIPLVLRILAGLIIGAILGILIPSGSGKVLSLLGEVFIGSLKALAPVLVFFLIMSSIAHSRHIEGKVIRDIIILYIVTTLIAAAVAVAVANIFPVKLSFPGSSADYSAAPQSLGDVIYSFILSIFINPVHALANGNYISILFWACIFGVVLKKAQDSTKVVLKDISNCVSKAIAWVIQFAPFGIMGISYTNVSSEGLSIFTDYGILIAELVGTMLFTSCVLNPILGSILLKRNSYPLLFRCLKKSAITAFFTRSSAANIPMNMELCRELELDEDVYSVTIPLGSIVNMDGAAVVITIMTLSAVFTLNIATSVPMMLFLSVIAALAACGTSGVAGGSLMLIPMACSIFGIPQDIAWQVVGIGFIIGVVQDSFETALNSSGDAFFTAIAVFRDWARKDNGDKIRF